MNKDKQRIAVAEACGWEEIEMEIRGIGAPERDPIPYGWAPRDHPIYGKWKPRRMVIPDYLNDLNAMHEAEEVLSVSDQVIYRGNLWNLTTNKTLCIRSTASQRAEAFLRTIGKWEEET